MNKMPNWVNTGLIVASSILGWTTRTTIGEKIFFEKSTNNIITKITIDPVANTLQLKYHQAVINGEKDSVKNKILEDLGLRFYKLNGGQQKGDAIIDSIMKSIPAKQREELLNRNKLDSLIKAKYNKVVNQRTIKGTSELIRANRKVEIKKKEQLASTKAKTRRVFRA